MKERSVNFFGEKKSSQYLQRVCNGRKKMFYVQSTAPDSIALPSFSH